ncbi:hypothetical protein JAAARDRAFT_32747, partial [Jaapia argillacea MUCL 33604]
TAVYCSKECQRRDWPWHKDNCKTIAAKLRSAGPRADSIFQRQLRHWVARFDISLTCAVVPALKLNEDFSNISKLAMYIIMQPRPHSNFGSRFTIKSCMVVGVRQFKILMEVHGPGSFDDGFEQHEKERKAMLARTNGETDFAMVGVLALNEGEHKLPIDVRFGLIFKPICIDRWLARAPQLVDPSIDWLADLKRQVERDSPNRGSGN